MWPLKTEVFILSMSGSVAYLHPAHIYNNSLDVCLSLPFRTVYLGSFTVACARGLHSVFPAVKQASWGRVGREPLATGDSLRQKGRSCGRAACFTGAICQCVPCTEPEAQYSVGAAHPARHARIWHAELSCSLCNLQNGKMFAWEPNQRLHAVV